MPDRNPLDLALATKRIGQPVEAVAHNAIDPLYSSCHKDLHELLGNGSGHLIFLPTQAILVTRPWETVRWYFIYELNGAQ